MYKYHKIRGIMQHCKSCRKEREPIEFKADQTQWKTFNSCRNKRRKSTVNSNPRLTIQKCQDFVKHKKIELLSTEVNSTKKITWRCSEGHI